MLQTIFTHEAGHSVVARTLGVLLRGALVTREGGKVLADATAQAASGADPVLGVALLCAGVVAESLSGAPSREVAQKPDFQKMLKLLRAERDRTS